MAVQTCDLGLLAMGPSDTAHARGEDGAHPAAHVRSSTFIPHETVRAVHNRSACSRSILKMSCIWRRTNMQHPIVVSLIVDLACDLVSCSIAYELRKRSG